MGISNDLFGGIGISYYRHKFQKHFEDFDSFLDFTKENKYHKFLSKKDYEGIYKRTKDYKFDLSYGVGHRRLTGYNTTSYNNPFWYYEFNKNKYFKIFDLLAKNLAQPNIEKAIKEEKIKNQELLTKERKHKQEEECKTIKIIDVFKSKKPFQNNASSIGIKFQILDMKETLIDYIIDPES